MSAQPDLAGPVASVQAVAAWMLSLRNSEGGVICPDHGIEHPGKNAGLVVMACELVRQGHGPAEHWYELAREQALRIAGRLEREGKSTCWTFRPGRHDPFNCSNNVIDGGACSDALGLFLDTFSDRVTPGVRKIMTRACVLHAQTYLRYAAFDKDIPAQRAWALTGVAAAWGQSGHEVLRYATIEGAKALLAECQADGSFRYQAPEGAAHPGATDVSSFYQSRVAAFLMYALERVGESPGAPRWRDGLHQQLQFLAALYGPDGHKVGLVEAKPWYHGANVEVASHPFDIYALARGARLFGDENLGRTAWIAWKAWAHHLEANGKPRAHMPGPGRRRSYQCPTFWAGHASWVARGLPDLEWLAERGWNRAPVPNAESRVSLFENAQLARLETPHWVAWVRGCRPPGNLHHGSVHGAGLLRFVETESGRERTVRCRFGTQSDWEWYGRFGLWPRFLTAWDTNKAELRFSYWLFRNRRRREGFLRALVEPWRAFRGGVLAFAATRVSSAWDREAQLTRIAGGVQVQCEPAYRDGVRVGGVALHREFSIRAGRLHIQERASGPKASKLHYVPGTQGDWIRWEPTGEDPPRP